MPISQPKQELDLLRRDADGAWRAMHGVHGLETAFQPIFVIRKGKLEAVACEALTRVSRGEARAMTEQFFASLETGERAHVEALTRTMHVRNAASLAPGLKRLFLNFDPAALSSPSCFDGELLLLGRELAKVNMSPRDVICEITENHVHDARNLTYFVYALRARGYTVAIDDFGAMASTPERVVQLAPDIVKIDGDWAKSLMSDAEGYRTLEKVVEGFESSGILTVIEGLQEFWQVEAAERMGASMMQGFAICPPRIMPASFAEFQTNPPLEPGRKTIVR